MNKAVITLGVILAAACSIYAAEGCQTKQQRCSAGDEKALSEKDQGQCCEETKDELKQILKHLAEQTDKLQTYQAKIKYLLIQDPELIDSRTIRTGQLYYKKDQTGSRIRINFETLKQDEADVEKCREHYIFDGVWLTKIDYQLEKVDLYQQAPEDEPIDVFTRISQNFPLIGFSKADAMDKQFEITAVSDLTSCDPNEPIHLRLKVKKDSIYKDDYKIIDFRLDKVTFLPLHIVAVSPEEDIYDIELLDSVLNKKFDNGVFNVETPDHFDKNRHPLKQEP
jgi:hypothetical protein